LVCRQIYQETRIRIYELNAFEFADEIAMRVFLSSRLPIQRRCIRVVVFPYGLAMNYMGAENFKIRNRLPKLEKLYLDDPHGYISKRSEYLRAKEAGLVVQVTQDM
jgi:hypothetical protein